MLRLKLFYGLLTIILLLWSVGAAALLLMGDTVTRFDNRLRMDYRSIDAAQTMRTLTATINTRYLPSLAGAPTEHVLDRTLYDELKKEIQVKQNIIHSDGSNDERWQGVVTRLDSAVASYFEGYETFFAGLAQTRGDREKLLQFQSTQTQRLTDLSENVMTLAEEKLFSGASQLRSESGKNTLFVGTLVLLGTSVAALIYFQLVRQLVDPVANLRRSIEEIRNGNFELTMPEPGQGSEFSNVVSAFNDMASELKVRRGENDESLLRANFVNRAILEAIPSPVFVLGDDTGIVQINPAAEQLTEELGVTGRLPLKIQRILDECREKSAHFLPEDPREALLFRIHEEEFYYLPRIFRFESENATESGWAVLLHNVSRIRWLDDMKTNLISTVSHEIKTPLTGIRMVLHLLLEERSSQLDEMQKLMVTSANEDCERLLVTLNTLLDLSRAESGTTHLALAPVSMKDSVARTAHLYQRAAAAGDLEIVTEGDENDYPQVRADPVRLDEVLNNLVSNAIKHSPRGGRVTIRQSQPDADYLRVSVFDQGAGVPDDSQSRIFERFYRAPGQKSDGVGLGLFISREIMRAHEGRIGLRERTNDLTEFYIDVPIA
ncbi:HAMP domain-containing protein [Luteolibacter yonseiensis]|uniref:histidine kinase n=1 Tax=Luteolibacter yonseiensis TaxID=1144680 RepID=A0A934V7E4_9BACT|nr:ATP-binding protein [Luteolibacter yonseiensis]MBK1816052.1 HAMP domain-containing protein [Luteolibacter yonseiensis]